MENLIKQIEAAFADSDAHQLQMFHYMEEARQLFRTMQRAYFDANQAYRRKEISEYERYKAQEEFYATFSKQFISDYGGKDEHIAREIKKVQANEARNVRIATKMAKAGITSIDATTSPFFTKDFTIVDIDGFHKNPSDLGWWLQHPETSPSSSKCEANQNQGSRVSGSTYRKIVHAFDLIIFAGRSRIVNVGGLVTLKTDGHVGIDQPTG
jgi:hypothetical protein